jgi:hypothetical protein
MDAIIIPCTEEKIWDDDPFASKAVPAKEAYTKPAFLAWRARAEESGSPWFVLSTKYGLIRPEQPIENYNIPVSRAAANPAFLQTLRHQGQALSLGQFDRIILFDWDRFEPLVRAAVADPKVKCVLRKILY